MLPGEAPPDLRTDLGQLVRSLGLAPVQVEQYLPPQLLSVTYRSPPRSATTPCSPWTAAVSWWRAARTSARGATSPPPCSSASTGASYLALRSSVTMYYLSPQRADRALVPAGHGPLPRRALRRAPPQRPLHPRREGGGRGAGHRVQARGQDMICPSVMSVYHVISQVK